MIQAKTGQFDMGDGILHYQIIGTGIPLVLSHAAFLDSRMFDAQVDVLAQHYQVIGYDMRGYGQSSAVAGPRCRRDDLYNLLQYLGITQAHFVGCSNGGTIMLDLALEYPDLVLSLTLVGSTPSGFELQGEPPRYVMEMFEAMKNGDIERANELQIRIWLDGSFREPGDVNKQLREKALRMNRIPLEQQTFFIADTQPTHPLDPLALTRLDTVQCPVLVMVGALDHSEVLRATDIMAGSIPNANKVIINSSGHVPSYEQPEIFNAKLLEFLGNQ